MNTAKRKSVLNNYEGVESTFYSEIHIERNIQIGLHNIIELIKICVNLLKKKEREEDNKNNVFRMDDGVYRL